MCFPVWSVLLGLPHAMLIYITVWLVVYRYVTSSGVKALVTGKSHIHFRYDIQSTPVLSCQLGAKIWERESSGSPIISSFLTKATINDLLVYRVKLQRLQLSNSMLSDKEGYLHFPDLYTHRHLASDKSRQAIVDFDNYSTKVLNYKLHEATHNGFHAKMIHATPRFDRKQKWFRACTALLHQRCMSFLVTNSQVIFQITLISTFPTK